MTSILFGPDGATARARSDELAALGHLLNVTVENSATGASQACNALIDTGASDVCIDYRVARRIGLTAVDERLIGVVGGSLLTTVYLGSISLPGFSFRREMPLYAAKVARLTHQILLGRSFLRFFTVTLDGPNGTFAFSTNAAGLAEPFDE